MKNDRFCAHRDFLPEFCGKDILLAGVDEVGRGALFGPVVAAAIVLPLSALPELIKIGVKDSKQLSAYRREKLVKPIQEVVANWQLSYATVREIDELNILQASILAMKRAVLQLEVKPAICLVDGSVPIPELSILQKTIVKGDCRSSAIAAASILAKVWRDNWIASLAVQYPQYDLTANKGYPTKKHRLALKQFGPCSEHRFSFRPCRFRD
ncbi:ribonuclease HII [Pleurocapsales cyanobacterium LEGE 06147]|nr:ribonuclease HII [Pleurocapsales cyanobacterium LEGE 06147]